MYPHQIKKIFGLRHHGVKSFWTKVGDFSPMPLILGLKEASCQFSPKILIFEPPGIFWKLKTLARERRCVQKFLIWTSKIISDLWSLDLFCPIQKKFPHSTLLCNSYLLYSRAGNLPHSLILLKSNEWLWAIRSDRSRQMSDCERIAQVAHDKWATVSDSLMSLTKNEQMSDLLNNIWQKKSKIFFFPMFYIRFYIFKSERFPHSLFLWGMWAHCSGCSPKMSEWANRSGRSPKMSEWAYLYFFSKSLIRSFFRKKRAIRSENRWANFQPCCIVGCSDFEK